MSQKRLCFELAGCVWVASFGNRTCCPVMERALPISRLYMADSEVWPEASRLYMAVACGERSENVPPKWLFSWVACHI